MSERGSFVTEYIYCPDCFSAVKRVFNGDGKYVKSCEIPGWTDCDSSLPIIAGKVGGMYPGEEFSVIEQLCWGAVDLICHSVRVSVLADYNEAIYLVVPKEGVDVVFKSTDDFYENREHNWL
jgi:hypothetical protein